MAIAATIAIGAVAGGLLLGQTSPLTDRLTYLGLAIAGLAACLAFAIGNIAKLRFFSPAAFDAASGGSQDDPAVRQGIAILHNTAEQALLAILVYSSLAVLVPRSAILLVILPVLFILGRLLFWRGYARGAEARALGFTITFYPSIAALVYVIADAASGLFRSAAS